MIKKDNEILWRMYLVYISTVIFGLVILGRVIYLQFFVGDYWREISRDANMQYVSIDAVRGDILADDGRLLATSVPIYEIRMDLDPNVISSDVFNRGVDSLALMLSRLFQDRSQQAYKQDLTQARREGQRYFLVKRNVSYHQLARLREFPIFRLGRYKGGLLIVERNRRETPFKTLAHRTIGYEREGVYVGLEGAYSKFLEGIQGKRLMQRISGGNWMPVNDENEISPRNGKDIITTININMQDIAESALMKQLKRYNAGHGSVVIMEVATGKIKAISNLTRTQSGTYTETFNYAVGESSEPGSTFKLASMIALLEDGYVKPDEFIQTGDGKVNFADRTMSDAKEGGFGTITVEDVFALSSNVGTSLLVQEHYGDQPEKFIQHLENLHLTIPHEIEIKGEGKPVIPRPGESGWSGVTLPWMSIGYGISLTSLQILSLYNAVANDGVYMKPMFVEEVQQLGKVIEQFDPVVIDHEICSRSTLRIIKDMMRKAVVSGTASSINTPLYEIAGKTGTAQHADENRGYMSATGRKYRASFVGYFPADDPAYSMIVIVHDPRGWIYTGSQVAAPVFREIADKIYATQVHINDNYLQPSLVASLPELFTAPVDEIKNVYSIFDRCVVNFNKEEEPWGFARMDGRDTIRVNPREFVPNLVPDVTGMSLSDALYVLENAGLRVRFTGRGAVKNQSLRPGTRIMAGSEIYINLS